MDKTYYTADIPYIVSNYIREYDMSKANISILCLKNVISKEMYTRLYNAPREQRQIEIGILQKDKKVAAILKSGIAEYREKFIRINQLTDLDILAVKNDALFVLNKIPAITDIDGIVFANKNTYTSFYKILSLELFYYSNDATGEHTLDVKGISDKKLELHRDNFAAILEDIFYIAERNISEAISMIKVIIDDYTNYRCPIEYYREFNSLSIYRVNPAISQFYTYHINNISASDLPYIDINCNLLILYEILKYYLTIWYSTKKR